MKNKHNIKKYFNRKNGSQEQQQNKYRIEVPVIHLEYIV